MIWLPTTLLAALFQAWRTAVQQRVRASISVNAAGLVRYLYGLPVALALLAGWMAAQGSALPSLSPAFFLWALLAGLAQIIGTNLLLMAFSFRSYVAGTAYAKTEAVQGAVLAMFLLGEVLSPLTWAGIAVGVAGVMALAGGTRFRWADVVQPAALCGLGAGLGFALTAIFVKAATRTLETQDLVLSALVTLVIVNSGQTLMQGGYLWLRERDQVAAVFRSWRTSAQVGVLAALGSACWFSAFAMAPVALVRAVGQVEVIFTLGFGHFYLREPLSRADVAGLLLVASGVVLALLGAL